MRQLVLYISKPNTHIYITGLDRIKGVEHSTLHYYYYYYCFKLESLIKW